MAEPKSWTYRDASAAAFCAQRLFWADAAFSAVVAMLALVRGLDPYRAGDADLLLGVGQLLVYLAAGTTALRWLYLASANARSLGATDLMGSPGLAVAWFFIPLANLFMPYMTMRDLWRASANPRDWQAAPAPGHVLLWWACWLVAGLTGIVAFRLQFEAAGEATQTLVLISSLAAIPAALLFAWLIGSIQAMQERTRPVL